MAGKALSIASFPVVWLDLCFPQSLLKVVGLFLPVEAMLPCGNAEEPNRSRIWSVAASETRLFLSLILVE